MKTVRICLHGFVLAFANLGSVIVGFILYRLLEFPNQIVVQIPVAAVLSIIAFVAWIWSIRHLPLKQFHLRRSRELIFTYLASLLWAPIMFVPLHYITQGYHTSGGNVVAILLFQLPVNGAAIVFAYVADFS